MLWFVHGIRADYPTFDYWWSARNEQERSAALLDAIDAIEQYGMPWLENPDAARPWEMPVQRNAEFVAAVQATLLPEIATTGLSAGMPISVWRSSRIVILTSACSDGTYALIELQPIYSLDPDEFNFDVRLQRRGDADPLAFSGDYAQWRSVSLAQLVCADAQQRARWNG